MKKYEKLVEIALFAGMIICTGVLFFYARYNFVYADDYAFASGVRSIWERNDISLINKLGGGICEALNLTGQQYRMWSGCYTSYFFSALQPGAFHDNLVFLHTFILLGIFMLCIFYFCFTFLKLLFGFDKEMLLVLSCGIVLLSTQWLPNVFSAFYWYNGAFYNIVGFSLMLLLIANIGRMNWQTGPLSPGLIVATFCAAVLFGGTNYSCILFFLLLGASNIIFNAIKRNSSRRRKLVAAVYLICMVFCLINIFAPGNGERQEYFSKMNPVAAVLKSLIVGRDYFLSERNIPLLFFCIIIFPLVWKNCKKSEFRFSCPLFVSALLYLFYCAMLTPALYAMGIDGWARTRNLYYWGGIMIHIFNYIYWVGWARRKMEQTNLVNSGFWHFMQQNYIYFVLLVLFFGISFGRDIASMSSVEAIRSIAGGEAQKWYDEMSLRQLAIKESKEEMMVLQKISSIPKLFDMDNERTDISTDPDYWVNRSMAEFYGVQGIILEE